MRVSSLVLAVFSLNVFTLQGVPVPLSKGSVPSSTGPDQFSSGLHPLPRSPFHPLVGPWHFPRGHVFFPETHILFPGNLVLVLEGCDHIPGFFPIMTWYFLSWSLSISYGSLFLPKLLLPSLVNLWLVGLSCSWNKPLPCSQRSSKLGNPKVPPWKWHDHRLVCDVKQDPTMAITKLS